MMITVERVARRKQRINLGLDGVSSGFGYDHETQLAHRKVDADVFRVSMKSDPAFDRESDPGDEK
jgi:hypothetical protein